MKKIYFMLLQVGMILELFDHFDGRPTKAEIEKIRTEIVQLQQQVAEQQITIEQVRFQRNRAESDRNALFQLEIITICVCIMIGFISYRAGKRKGLKIKTSSTR